MKKLKNKMVFFTIGGIGYAIIELLWRRKTHWSMVVAGGVCFVFFSEISKKHKNEPLLFKAALGALGVTGVELIFGIIFNKILKMDVWDYSDEAFNFLGQICPLFTLMWGGLAMIFLPLADALNEKMSRPEANPSTVG